MVHTFFLQFYIVRIVSFAELCAELHYFLGIWSWNRHSWLFLKRSMEAFILGFWSKIIKPECLKGTKYSILLKIKTIYSLLSIAKEVNAKKENLKSKLNSAWKMSIFWPTLVKHVYMHLLDTMNENLKCLPDLQHLN